MTEQPAAGWYPDPLGRFDHRYWDGTGWTEHVSRAGVQAVDPPTGTPAATSRSAAASGPTWQQQAAGTSTWDQPARSATVNVKAILSLVLSLTWTLGLTSIAAIVLGIMARREIRASGGRESGDGMALAGIIIGILGVLVPIGLILLFTAVSVGSGGMPPVIVPG